MKALILKLISSSGSDKFSPDQEVSLMLFSLNIPLLRISVIMIGFDVSVPVHHFSFVHLRKSSQTDYGGQGGEPYKKLLWSSSHTIIIIISLFYCVHRWEYFFFDKSELNISFAYTHQPNH